MGKSGMDVTKRGVDLSAHREGSVKESREKEENW